MYAVSSNAHNDHNPFQWDLPYDQHYQHRCYSTVVHLIDEGADVHYENDKPLLQAVHSEQDVFLKLLCEHGADPLACDGAILAAAATEKLFDHLLRW